MAIPVITQITDIQVAEIGRTFVCQIVATNTPTSWTVLGLPSWATLTVSSGSIAKIEGVAPSPGEIFYDVIAKATNGTGDSLEMIFSIAVEPAAYVPGMAVELDWNLDDNTVSRPRGSSAGEALLYLKRNSAGDKIRIALALKKGDIYLDDVAAVLIHFAAKVREPESPISLTDGSFQLVGIRKLITLDLAHLPTPGTKIKSELSDVEKDKGTGFDALAEFQLTYDEDTGGEVPEEFYSSSQTFKIRIDRGFRPIL